MGSSQQPTTNWMGSLIGGQRDPGGTMYMRNRYYDPATSQFTQPDPIGIGGGLNTYGFAAGDPANGHDPFGLWCQVRDRDGSGESLHCENLRPGDWWTIKNYLGGATGDAVFSDATRAGLTAWNRSTCRGGFSYDQCGRVAQSMSWLINSRDAQCSELGTNASQRFQSGGYKYREGLIRGGMGFSIAPWSDRVWLSGELWTMYDTKLTESIVHEEAHIAYWIQHAVFSRGVHYWGNPRDYIFEISGRCSAGLPY